MSMESEANANKDVAGGESGETMVEVPNGNAGAELGADASSSDVSDAELAALREKAGQAEMLREQYVRTLAEFENFRKRSARDRQEAVQYANQGLLERLIPALDNLDMALVAVSAAQGASVESLKTGVEMVLSQLRGVLKESGLEEISALGQVFDPTWHEAVSQQETAEVPEGQVVQQLRKGYRLQQRLLRPATVVVAKKPNS